MNKITKKVLDGLLYYPVYIFLRLSGFRSKKWKLRLVTEKLSDYLFGYAEISDGNGRTAHFRWKDLLTLKNHFRGRIKRYLLFWFRKGYVETQMLKRRGGCIRCGYCCHQLSCSFAVQNGKIWECSIYPYWPVSCTVYPITQKDVIEYNCPGFYFEQYPETIPSLSDIRNQI
jgi:hypothetical protein